MDRKYSTVAVYLSGGYPKTTTNRGLLVGVEELGPFGVVGVWDADGRNNEARAGESSENVWQDELAVGSQGEVGHTTGPRRDIEASYVSLGISLTELIGGASSSARVCLDLCLMVTIRGHNGFP